MKFSVLVCILLLISYNASAQSPGANLFADGMKAYQQGRYEEAVSKLKSATTTLTDQKERASAYLALGIIYQLLNDEDQAKIEFSRAIIENPELKLDRDFYSSKTIQLFDEARQEGLSRIKRGKELYLTGNYEEALESISTGINLLLATSPKIERHIIIDGYLTAATIYQLNAKNDLAVQEFLKALRTNPELSLDPELYSSSTMELFQRAKNSGDQIVQKAGELIGKKDYAAAIDLLEKNQANFFSKNTIKEANFKLAQAYFLKQQEDKAITAIQAVLSVDPAYDVRGAVVEASFREFYQKERLKRTGTMPKVLIVKSSDNPVHDLTIQGFKQEVTADLREAGTENVADQIRSYKPKVIFVTGANSLQSVNKIGDDIPVIFANVPKSEAGSYADNNVGGIYWEVPADAQFSFLTAVLPKAKKVGVIYNKKITQELVDEATRAARKYGIQLVPYPAEGPSELNDAMKVLSDIDVLWMLPDKSIVNSVSVFKELLALTMNKGIPLLAFHESFVKEGALFSVSSDFVSMGRQAAELVENLLLNPSVKNLPTLFPTLSKLSINLKTAKKLNLELNPNVVSSASLIYR